MEQELTEVFRRALRTAGFIGGPMVEEFETTFAEFCAGETRRGREQRNRRASLRFDGLRWSDRAMVVVTVPNTFIATTEAISPSGRPSRIRGYR